MWKDPRTGIWQTRVAARQYSLKTSNKKLAQEREAKIKTDFVDGTFGIRRKSRILFYELAEIYLRKIKDEEKKKGIKSRLEKHIYPTFSNRVVMDLKRLEVQDWADSLATKLEPDGVNRIITVFRSIVRWGIQHDMGIPFDPIQAWPRYKVSTEVWTMLTPEEAKQVIECDDPDFTARPFVIMGMYTGLRLGNIVNLRWSQIDLQNSFIRIEASETKGKTFITIPLLPEAKKVILEFKGKDSEFVFVKKNGRPWNDKSVSRAWRLGKVLCSIERKFRFHDLRHTFASYLTMQGKSETTVATLLGHKSVATTKRYQHLSPEFLQGSLNGFSFDSCQQNVSRNLLDKEISENKEK
jgi:integrase